MLLPISPEFRACKLMVAVFVPDVTLVTARLGSLAIADCRACAKAKAELRAVETNCAEYGVPLTVRVIVPES